MRKFLASVGNAELLEKVDGKLQLFATAHTLTDSSINITSTMEEIRAGQGAQLVGRFNHDTGMTVTLTDAMFDLKYITAQVGAHIEENGAALASYNHTVITNFTANSITLPTAAQTIGSGCGLDKIVIFVKPIDCGEAGETQAYEVEPTEGTNTYSPVSGVFAVPENGKYCISYFEEKAGARTAKIVSSFNPKEMVLILTANLFAGDASHPESGRPVGTITVKIPRFQLDGSFDLSMAMSSAATTNIAGTALASESGDCDTTGVYAEIVEVIEGRTVTPKALVFEDGDDALNVDDLTIGAKLPDVYAIYTDNSVSVVDPAELTYTTTAETLAIGADGRVTTAATGAGVITATLKNTTIATTIQVIAD